MTDSFISFTDEDGEVAHFRVRDIAIIEIAKDVTDAEPLEEDEEDEVQSEGRLTVCSADVFRGHRQERHREQSVLSPYAII